MCKYLLSNSQFCKEANLPNYEYCVLHIDFPLISSEKELHRINSLKEKKIKEKIITDDIDFDGAKLNELIFQNYKPDKGVVNQKANFNNVHIYGDMDLCHWVFLNKISIKNAVVDGDVNLSAITTYGNIDFSNSIIQGNLYMNEALIVGDVVF